MAKQADLLAVEDARARILERFARLETETVPLPEAQGRVLARDLVARQHIPPFANSSMDGFAVIAADTEAASPTRPVSLQVTHHIPAGFTGDVTISPSSCARIMTGAPLPAGADSVVPFEDVEDEGEHIVLRSPVREAACVRPAGQDISPGDNLLASGTVLFAQHVALLASIGSGMVEVIRRPRVSIISTGDELVVPGETLQRGQIYNSNAFMLEAAVREAGGEPHVLPTAGDDRAAIAQTFDAARDSDLILTSGGASVGDHDHVKEVLAERGEVGFWRVRVRPGRPLIFGNMGRVPVLGLPGNPTSAMVTFELFAWPAIRSMLGAPTRRTTITARAGEDFDNRGGRRSYVRVRLEFEDGSFTARAAGPQDSAMIRPLAAAHGLLVIPEEEESMPAGSWAKVLVWRLPQSG